MNFFYVFEQLRTLQGIKNEISFPEHQTTLKRIVRDKM